MIHIIFFIFLICRVCFGNNIFHDYLYFNPKEYEFTFGFAMGAGVPLITLFTPHYLFDEDEMEFIPSSYSILKKEYTFSNPDNTTGNYCTRNETEVKLLISEACQSNDGVCVDQERSKAHGVLGDENVEVFCKIPEDPKFMNIYHLTKFDEKFKIKIDDDIPMVAFSSKDNETFSLFGIRDFGLDFVEENNWKIDITVSVDTKEPLGCDCKKVVICQQSIIQENEGDPEPICYEVDPSLLTPPKKEEFNLEEICGGQNILVFPDWAFEDLVIGENELDPTECFKNIKFLEDLIEEEIMEVDVFDSFANSVDISHTSFPVCVNSTFYKFDELSLICRLIEVEKPKCPNDCFEHGECLPGLYNKTKGICHCYGGYSGVDCLFPICHYIPSNYINVCHGNGICIEPDKCHCNHGYEGTDCELPICSQGDCVHGYCEKPDYCRCLYGYKGPLCDIPECNPDCMNGGVCHDVDMCNCTIGYYGQYCAENVGNRFQVMNSKIVRLDYQIETRYLGYLYEEKAFPCGYIITNSDSIFGKYPKTTCYFSCLDEKYPDEGTKEHGSAKDCLKTKYLVIEMMNSISFYGETKIVQISPITTPYKLKDDESSTIKIKFKPSIKEKVKAVVEKHFSSAVMVIVIVCAVLVILLPVLFVMCALICCLIYCQIFCCCFRILGVAKDLMNVNADQFRSFKRLEDELDEEALSNKSEEAVGNQEEGERNVELKSIINEVNGTD